MQVERHPSSEGSEWRTAESVSYTHLGFRQEAELAAADAKVINARLAGR